MKIKKKFKKVVISTCLLLFLSVDTYIYADEKVSISPIFTHEEGMWHPGRIESKDFYISNNNENSISIDRVYMELKSSKDLSNNQFLDINSGKFKELAENSTVKLNYKNIVLFEDKLNNLLSEKGIVLSEEINIKSSEKEFLNMTIDMDEEMNNDVQALENIFSIGVAYKIDETNQSIEPPIKPELPVNPDNGVGGESDKLPQTGGIINATSLLAIGTIAIGTGIVLNKKSLKEKGGKHHE